MDARQRAEHYVDTTRATLNASEPGKLSDTLIEVASDSFTNLLTGRRLDGTVDGLVEQMTQLAIDNQMASQMLQAVIASELAAMEKAMEGHDVPQLVELAAKMNSSALLVTQIAKSTIERAMYEGARHAIEQGWTLDDLARSEAEYAKERNDDHD